MELEKRVRQTDRQGREGQRVREGMREREWTKNGSLRKRRGTVTMGEEK